MERTLRSVVIIASLLCPFAAAATGGQLSASPHADDAVKGYSARVKKDEARFTMPVPAREVWKWRVPETRERAREYMLAVRVHSGDAAYTFGFYLWKFPGSSQGSGRFSSLLAAGQKSLFERRTPGQNIMVRDADVRVKQDKDQLVITVVGRRNVERLFSGRPAEVTFMTELPGEPPSARTIAVTYAN